MDFKERRTARNWNANSKIEKGDKPGDELNKLVDEAMTQAGTESGQLTLAVTFMPDEPTPAEEEEPDTTDQTAAAGTTARKRTPAS